MKEHWGKVLGTIVFLAIILTIGWIFQSIFAKPENIDMFIVWMIFVAADIKLLLQGSWNLLFIWVGGVLSLVYVFYYFVKLLALEGKRLSLDSNSGPMIEDREEWSDKEEEKFQRFGKPIIKFGIASFVFAFGMQVIAAGIPSAKQAAVIYIVPKIVNNADMREIPPNLAKLVNEGLKDMIKDLQKDATDSVKGAVAKGIQKSLEGGEDKKK